jgi:hypothetical protein
MLDDSVVARTVHAARLLEKACHDQGQWTIALGNSAVIARRFLTEDAVVIEAEFAPQCWVYSPDRVAELRLNGEAQDVRPVAVPDEETEFTVRWRFTVIDPHVVSLRDSS